VITYTIIKRHLKENNPDQGVPIEKYLLSIDKTEKRSFEKILEQLKEEGALKIKRDCIFIGSNFEAIFEVKKNQRSLNILSNCQLSGPTQIGNENQMSITSSDIDHLIKLIESLAMRDDPSLADSVINIVKKTKDSYAKIKDLISILKK